MAAGGIDTFVGEGWRFALTSEGCCEVGALLGASSYGLGCT
ncbi:hypothetical protein TIFTF001_055953, partial [Ficus carica]